ncbi:unnamed protein product [Amoebophrya sp. A120]|nr:unnamed protein product [Amoebophrya sp. A120]|eukprot:GSA120T00016321001.1
MVCKKDGAQWKMLDKSDNSEQDAPTGAAGHCDCTPDVDLGKVGGTPDFTQATNGCGAVVGVSTAVTPPCNQITGKCLVPDGTNGMHTCGTIGPEEMAAATLAKDIPASPGNPANEVDNSAFAPNHFYDDTYAAVHVPRVICDPPVGEARWVWIMLPSGTAEQLTRQLRITELAACIRSWEESVCSLAPP